MSCSSATPSVKSSSSLGIGIQRGMKMQKCTKHRLAKHLGGWCNHALRGSHHPPSVRGHQVYDLVDSSPKGRMPCAPMFLDDRRVGITFAGQRRLSIGIFSRAPSNSIHQDGTHICSLRAPKLAGNRLERIDEVSRCSCQIRSLGSSRTEQRNNELELTLLSRPCRANCHRLVRRSLSFDSHVQHAFLSIVSQSPYFHWQHQSRCR